MQFLNKGLLILFKKSVYSKTKVELFKNTWGPSLGIWNLVLGGCSACPSAVLLMSSIFGPRFSSTVFNLLGQLSADWSQDRHKPMCLMTLLLNTRKIWAVEILWKEKDNDFLYVLFLIREVKFISISKAVAHRVWGAFCRVKQIHSL